MIVTRTTTFFLKLVSFSLKIDVEEFIINVSFQNLKLFLEVQASPIERQFIVIKILTKTGTRIFRVTIRPESACRKLTMLLAQITSTPTT